MLIGERERANLTVRTGRFFRLVRVELPRQNLRSMPCTGSQFASCANSVISLRVVALARLYVRPARTGDPAAPYGAGEQLLLFVVRLLQFTRPSLLLFKCSLCWRTGRAHAAQCNSRACSCGHEGMPYFI